MKVLVFGASGFIGRNVCKELEKDHKIIRVTKEATEDGVRGEQSDLLDRDSVLSVLKKASPEVVINCAGIVNAATDTDLNVQFTKNILEQSRGVESIGKIIVCGSASEYGLVSPENIPVNESTPLNAESGYGLSKLNEERFATDYGKKHNIQVVVLRIFNPIGKGMADKFLLTKLLNQVQALRAGERDSVEVTRLDSKRDYVSIKDVALAFRAVVDKNPNESIYNVGSGVSTTNGELLELILKNSKLDSMPKIIETSNKVEPLVAIQADITRISNEFGWHPMSTTNEEIREIVQS